MDIKHVSGFDFGYMERHLEEFDRYCLLNWPGQTELTRELALGWATDTISESAQERDKRFRTMRHLGSYLRSVGIDAFVCQTHVRIPKPEQPQIFTDEQLAEFFSTCDNLPDTPFSPLRNLVAPVLFRVIYCCGLRNSEACNIRYSDIDLNSGIIKIMGSKRRKDRLVYLADDVAVLCSAYDKRMCSALFGREYFFLSGTGNHLVNSSACSLFDGILAMTSFAGHTSRKPTCHGLRHLFAINSMRKCLTEGHDFDSAIHYLSRYMGHKGPQETLYYLHAIPNIAGILREMGSGLNDVIGGVRHVQSY
jgi:integrase